MNRDALVATFIGFFIGLSITGLVLFGPNLMKSLPSLKLPSFSFSFNRPKPTATPTEAQNPNIFTITAPLPDAIENKATVLVSGTAPPSSIVIIQGYENEVVTKPNGNNGYASEVELVEGKNEILVTNYENGNAETKSVTVFYTEEDF